MNVDYIGELKEEVDHGEKMVKNLANEVLGDERFRLWPASIDKHHAEVGGLAKHVYEVYSIAIQAALATKVYDSIDKMVLYFSVLYHDVGKFHDYKLINEAKPHVLVWEKSKHSRLIHHISRSAIMWSHDICKYPELYPLYYDKVLHCILSHHGRREWGSPIAPCSREAWLLHLSDAMSARMDDCMKVDWLDIERGKK